MHRQEGVKLEYVYWDGGVSMLDEACPNYTRYLDNWK